MAESADRAMPDDWLSRLVRVKAVMSLEPRNDDTPKDHLDDHRDSLLLGGRSGAYR